MTARWYTAVVDAADPQRLAAFWAAALGWAAASQKPDEVAIEAPDDPQDRIPAIVFRSGARLQDAQESVA